MSGLQMKMVQYKKDSLTLQLACAKAEAKKVWAEKVAMDAKLAYAETEVTMLSNLLNEYIDAESRLQSINEHNLPYAQQTHPNSDAPSSFATRSEETQSQEATAQVQIQQVVPTSGTCAAKVDDQLFSPELGKCFDLINNWWDNKIQTITGGGAGVCVDVWELGFQKGDHQRVCGSGWVDTSFPISHLCCTEE